MERWIKSSGGLSAAYLSRPGMNSEANSLSPLKRTTPFIHQSFNPFQRVFAMSLEIDFKADDGEVFKAICQDLTGGLA